MQALGKFFNAVYTGTWTTGTDYSKKDDKERQKIALKMYKKYKTSFPKVQDMEPSELQQLLQAQKAHLDADGPVAKSKLLIVDCRSKEEIEVSRIKPSMRKEEFHSLLDTDASFEDVSHIVFYCTIGYRSGLEAKKVAEKFKGKGIADKIYNLTGSLLNWVHCEGEVVDKCDAAVQKVHVYGKAWDLAPTTYETEVF